MSKIKDILFRPQNLIYETEDSVRKYIQAFSSATGINPKGITYWHDDTWFRKKDPDHKLFYEYLIEMGFGYREWTDSSGDQRIIIEYVRFEQQEYVPLHNRIKELSWELLATLKLQSVSQQKTKSSTSATSSWLSTEKLFGNMNRALLFALKTWRQLKKLPKNSTFMATVIVFAAVIVLTQVM